MPLQLQVNRVNHKRGKWKSKLDYLDYQGKFSVLMFELI